MTQDTSRSVDERRVTIQERLLDLAGTYRSLNRKELAQALGREGSKLAPSNGNPKLDYLMLLAEVLDWPVGDVAEAIWGGGDWPLKSMPAADFDALDREAREAHRDGDYTRMLELAVRMDAAARSPQERARAALREAGAWAGRGRSARKIEAVRRGLRQSDLPDELRLLLQVNLANAHYALGHLFEARALSSELIQQFNDTPPGCRATRAAQAFAYYVLGNSCRHLIAQAAERPAACACPARDALKTSQDLYTGLADEFDHDPWYGIANTCRGGILEADVEIGSTAPASALAVIREGLAESAEAGATLVGDRLESYGWWCIFGCNIAHRHFDGRERQQHLVSLLARGYEIANTLNNWSMRERLFSIELLQRQQLNELAGVPVEWPIGDDNVRELVGTMGRFPSFRSTGWHILQTATPVRPSGRELKSNAPA